VTITFQDGELRHLLREHTQATQPGLLAHEQDQILVYPEWLGWGHKRDIELPSGVSLTLHHYHLKKELINLCEPGTSDCFEFVFSLTTQYVFNDEQRLGRQQGYLIGLSDRDGRWRELAGENSLSVDVHLEPTLMAALLNSYEAVLPEGIRRIVEGWTDVDDPEWGAAIAPTPITPAIEMALRQILHCPYQGLTQKLYLEAKSLELIALFIEAFQEMPLVPVGVNRDECDRLHHAQQILRDNL